MKNARCFTTVLCVTLMAGGCATTSPSYLQETEHARADNQGAHRAKGMEGVLTVVG